MKIYCPGYKSVMSPQACIENQCEDCSSSLSPCLACETAISLGIPIASTETDNDQPILRESVGF